MGLTLQHGQKLASPVSDAPTKYLEDGLPSPSEERLAGTNARPLNGGGRVDVDKAWSSSGKPTTVCPKKLCQDLGGKFQSWSVRSSALPYAPPLPLLLPPCSSCSLSMSYVYIVFLASSLPFSFSIIFQSFFSHCLSIRRFFIKVMIF